MKPVSGETSLIKSTVFEDNNGALTTSNSVKNNPRTKHIGVKYQFFKHHYGEGSDTTLVKVDTLMQNQTYSPREYPDRIS